MKLHISVAQWGLLVNIGSVCRMTTFQGKGRCVDYFIQEYAYGAGVLLSVIIVTCAISCVFSDIYFVFFFVIRMGYGYLCVVMTS